MIESKLLFLGETGEVIALPPFADPLSNDSLSQVLDLVNNQDDSSTNVPISNGPFNPFDPDEENMLPGDGVYYCNQSSNGITTNFVNANYPSFNNVEVNKRSLLHLPVKGRS